MFVFLEPGTAREIPTTDLVAGFGSSDEICQISAAATVGPTENSENLSGPRSIENEFYTRMTRFPKIWVGAPHDRECSNNTGLLEVGSKTEYVALVLNYLRDVEWC